MAQTTRGTADQTNGPDEPGLGTIERVLAYMFVGIIALTVIGFLVLMIGSMNAWFDEQTYVFLVTLIMIGLPVALVLMIVLTVRLAIRRARDNRAR